MLRHEFQPGRLVAGFFLTAAGLVYAGDAGGVWDTPWFAVIPIVMGGLFLAALVATVTHGIRRGRGSRSGGGASGGHPEDRGLPRRPEAPRGYPERPADLPDSTAPAVPAAPRASMNPSDDPASSSGTPNRTPTAEPDSDRTRTGGPGAG